LAAVSQDSVEIVRAALRAIRDRDRRAAATLFTPDAEWHNTSSFPGPRMCVGPDAIIDFWVTLTEDFDDFRDEIEQVLVVDDRVVLEFHQSGSGRQSGVPFDLRYAAIFELVDQRVARVDIHGGYAKAVNAVGLSE
jgi:ketosteroid isomerase-like protein